MNEKPILFNSEMVRAILDGRKTQTRRAIKQLYSNTVLEMKTDKYGTRLIEIEKDVEGVTFWKNPDGSTRRKIRGYIEPRPPFKKYDILYVREKWTRLYYVDPDGYTHYDKEMYYYAADGTPDITLYDADGFTEEDQRIRWRPSIHMPKKAARLFLMVKDIRCERLQDISLEDCHKEGINESYVRHEISGEVECDFSIERFITLWDSTIKKSDFPKYGWDANPWVWVVEFERIKDYKGGEVEWLTK